MWIVFSSSNHDKKGKEKLFLVVICLIIFVNLSFADLRNLSDVDWYNYMYTYLVKHSIEDFYNIPELDYFEYGFVLFAKILTLFSDSYRFLYIARGFLTAVIFYYVIKKYSTNVYLSGIVAFLFSGGFDQATYVVRQYMAVVIFLLAIRPILNKQLLKFLLIWGVSFSLHRSAAVLLPLYFIYNYVPIYKWNLVKTIIIISVPAFFSFTILNSLSAQFNIFVTYFVTTDYVEEDLGSAGMAMRSFFILVPFFIIYKKSLLNPFGRFLFITSALSFILSFGMIGVPAGSRLFPCYNYFSMLSVPWIYSNLPIKYKHAYLYCVIAIFVFLYIHEMPLVPNIPYMWD